MNQGEALWALYHIQPATAEEVREFMEPYVKHPQTAGDVLLRLHRDGIVTRSRLESDGTIGEQPYEYEFSDVEELEHVLGVV